ncbi:hypothetical protein Hamer_G018602, partial [Homarus americanus]
LVGSAGLVVVGSAVSVVVVGNTASAGAGSLVGVSAGVVGIHGSAEVGAGIVGSAEVGAGIVGSAEVGWSVEVVGTVGSAEVVGTVGSAEVAVAVGTVESAEEGRVESVYGYGTGNPVHLEHFDGVRTGSTLEAAERGMLGITCSRDNVLVLTAGRLVLLVLVMSAWMGTGSYHPRPTTDASLGFSRH